MFRNAVKNECETETQPAEQPSALTSIPLQPNKQQTRDASPNVSTVTDENTSRLSTFSSQLMTSTPNGGNREVTAAVSSVTSPSSTAGSNQSSQLSLSLADDESNGHVAVPSRNSSAHALPTVGGDASNSDSNAGKKRPSKKIPPPPPPRKGSRVTTRSGSHSDNAVATAGVDQNSAPPTYENIHPPLQLKKWAQRCLSLPFLGKK